MQRPEARSSAPGLDTCINLCVRGGAFKDSMESLEDLEVHASGLSLCRVPSRSLST